MKSPFCNPNLRNSSKSPRTIANGKFFGLKMNLINNYIIFSDFFELHKIIGQYFALTKMQTNKLEAKNNKLEGQMNAKMAAVEEENRKLKLQVKMQADVLLKMQLKSLESAKKDLETTTGFVEFKKSMEKELAEIWAKIANNEMGKEQLAEDEKEEEKEEGK
jgi:trehalose/maltose hydrolase-like predicted phosphorylase